MKKLILITALLFNFNLVYSQTKILEAEDKEVILQEIEVKEGQTLSYIASYYLKDPKQWPEILKYNKLSTSDIYAPLPGMKLKVPVYIVKEKFRPAYLVYILNKVKYRKRDSVVWEEPIINMELYNDDAIATYENSRANIKFYSGEILSVDENSFITIRPELKQEEVTLYKGGVRATKAKVITDTSEIVPRIDPKNPKTDFRTKIREEDKATLVEVYEGAVDVTAQGKTVYVPKGFGTEVKPLSPPSPPKALPPPPEIKFLSDNVKLSENNELILNNSVSQISLQLVEPKIDEKQILPFVPEQTNIKTTKQKTSEHSQQQKPKVLGQIIKKYHLQIAKDTEFKKIVYDKIEEITPDSKINLDLKQLQLADGKYYYRLSYIDELGFENPAIFRPIIIDTTPPKLITNLKEITKVEQEVLNISGETEPEAIVKLNEINVEVDKDGKFVASLILNPGINKITLIAKDRFNNEARIEHQVERVKSLTKQEKEEQKLKKKQSEELDKRISSLGTIIAAVVSSAVVTFVLLFFLK